MTAFFVFLHVTVSIALIGIVLLQSGKGAEMGASFGAGGSQSVFGASGGNTFMSKLTTGAAIIFMLTSLTLAYISGSPGAGSMMSSQPRPAQPAAPQKAAQPQPGGMPVAPAPVQQPVPVPAPKK